MLISGYARNATVRNSEFAWLGEKSVYLFPILEFYPMLIFVPNTH